MPIYADTLRETTDILLSHLNSLLHATITYVPLQRQIVESAENGVRTEHALIHFYRRAADGDRAVELATRYGPIDLYIGQTCDLYEEPGTARKRLRTTSYTYTLQPKSWDDRMIRWEYVMSPGPDSYWNRHHIQGPIAMQIDEGEGHRHEFTLNDWHLPTGWVALEDVVRFCLHDLGVPAHCDRDAWHQLLVESANRFRSDGDL